MEPLILKAHGALIIQTKRTLTSHFPDQIDTLKRLALQRLYYDPDLSCGILETKIDADTATIRNTLVPLLDLPIRLKASILSDTKSPIVSAFTPSVYQTYGVAEWLELLQSYNPILSDSNFIFHEEVKKKLGSTYYFRTTDSIVEYLKNHDWTLEHALGQTIFNQRIEYEPQDLCLTRIPPDTMDDSCGPPQTPDIPVTKDTQLEEGQLNDTLPDQPTTGSTKQEKPSAIPTDTQNAIDEVDLWLEDIQISQDDRDAFNMEDHAYLLDTPPRDPLAD